MALPPGSTNEAASGSAFLLGYNEASSLLNIFCGWRIRIRSGFNVPSGLSFEIAVIYDNTHIRQCPLIIKHIGGFDATDNIKN
jgi:hypothetical protein